MNSNIRVPELNSVLMSGRLTRDPEYRSTNFGPVCSFDIALNRSYRDSSGGEWKVKVTYIRVNVWNQQADRCRDRLRKGSPVIVEGSIEGREFTDKTGQKRKLLEVTARRVQMLLSQQGEKGAGDEEQLPAEEMPQGESDSGGIEEVPF